jgi:hypothetical protein
LEVLDAVGYFSVSILQNGATWAWYRTKILGYGAGSVSPCSDPDRLLLFSLLLAVLSVPLAASVVFCFAECGPLSCAIR